MTNRRLIFPYQMVDNKHDDFLKLLPPLNTDIRFAEFLPEYDPIYSVHGDINHPHKPHVHEKEAENFSWHQITSDDNFEIVAKKKLINPIQEQHLCGSCWAMSVSAAMSDCFVVSGVVNWMPNISATYMMMVIPSDMGNNKCKGGNPALACKALESISVADTTCIDYSWCSMDTKVCATSRSVDHFKADVSDVLNERIPPNKGCYFQNQKICYKLDSGSEAFYITPDISVDTFRAALKAHIVDFGPAVTGFPILKNFASAIFTNPVVNEGIYLDRVNYDKKPIIFSDDNASKINILGFHAVRIVGWGVGKNIQYDTDKYGDVPYWIAANSWGSHWGHMKGYFKMAMYPFNKFAQFDNKFKIDSRDSGGVILMRATKKPFIEEISQIDADHFNQIKRAYPDEYYLTSKPVKTQINETKTVVVVSSIIVLFIVLIIIIKLFQYKTK